MNLTVAQLAILRTQPHRTRLFLSIYQPKTIFSARVTGSFNQGDTQINYFSVLTGSYQNTYPNMTVKIGSTENSDDKGRLRLRATTGTYAVFAENNQIWGNGDYLTFIDFINIEAVFPKIIQDPNNPEAVIFYKDNDVPYSNQNTVYGTFPCAGTHRAGFLETGTVSFFYTSTGSYNVRGDSLTYSWAFEGGSPTGSTAADPGWVNYTATGHYKTRLIITSSSGAQDTTYRYVSVYNKPEEGTRVPILKWEINGPSESRDEGGCTASIKVRENLGSIEPNALVVIWAEDWYGGNKISLGGNSQNNSSIVFVGYILKDSIRFNYREGSAEFDVGSPTEVMKAAEGFSVSCESKASPTTWFELQEMTVAKALYHYLRWHSTLLSVTDYQYTGDDRLVQFFDADRGSLYDAVNSFVQNGLIGQTVSDRQGKIWAEITPTGYVNPMTSIPAGMTIQKQDWMGEPQLSERRTAEMSFIEMGGIVYLGVATNQFFACLSNAPSLTPLYRGKNESPFEGLILTSQNQLNQLAGNYLAQANSAYSEVTLDSMAGNFRNLGIAPQERVFLDINPADTVIGKSTVGIPFRLISMDWTYNAEKETFRPQCSFQQIATGTAGVTVDIPLDPPDVDGGYGFPDFNLPPLFTFPTTPTTSQISRTVLALDDEKGFIWTKDFDAVSPTWAINNNIIGIPSTNFDPQMMTYFIAPNGSSWVCSHSYEGSGFDPAIYYAPSVDALYTRVVSLASLQALYPGAALVGIAAMGYDPSQPERIAFIAQSAGPFNGHFYIGNHSGFTQKVQSLVGTGGGRRGNLTYDIVNRKWVAGLTASDSTQNQLIRYNLDGSSEENRKSVDGDLVFQSFRARDTGRLFANNDTSGKLIVTVDNGTTIEEIGDGQLVVDGFFQLFNRACDPTGQYHMATWTAAAKKGRSSDFGYTWTGIPNLPPGNEYAFAYCGGEGLASQWIAARGIVRYSPDWGNTWQNKEGNLLTLIPIPDIRGLAVHISYKTV